MRDRQPIVPRVHYPETIEEIESLKKSQAAVIIDILEKQLGEEMVEKLFNYMKKKVRDS